MLIINLIYKTNIGFFFTLIKTSTKVSILARKQVFINHNENIFRFFNVDSSVIKNVWYLFF